MLDFLNRKNEESLQLTTLLAKLCQIYKVDEIEEDRTNYLRTTIEKFGYLPYPQFKVLEELSDGEAIFCLIEKLKYEKTFKNKEIISFKNPSALLRRGIKNSNWFKKEGHNIKLLSLSALSDDSKKKSVGHFIDWIKCLITLNSGNRKLNILPTTLYLIPFFEREFDCAYLPKSSQVSKKLEDENLLKFLGLEADEQVKLFIKLAQLSGHPVIYDILPQTSRFSKLVLMNPSCARWVDIIELTDSLIDNINGICGHIMQKRIYNEQDIIRTKKLYINNLKGTKRNYVGIEKTIAQEIEDNLLEFKISISNKMISANKQEKILKKVQKVINSTTKQPIKKESDIINQDEITNALIKEGLWTLPGGAWCSSGVPVFDKMSAGKKYPIFKHYNYKKEDVTKFANLDCQTPFYFYLFKEKKYNKKVIDFYINYITNIQKEYNFDGFRIDHIDHIVDCYSQDEKQEPISYRIPSKVLAKLNSTLKKQTPWFALLAEYMLWDGYYKEYHKDMKFDLLWGDDIVSQSYKTPEQIINDNLKLSDYNQQSPRNHLSILKTYNNQDGEFRDINRFPGQLGSSGALFKWFKLKFIPGGKYAQRPVMFVDGDESFTKVGIERVISKETSMIRNTDWSFWEKFNALDYFASNDTLLNKGKANLLCQNNNGFVCWTVSSEDKKAKKESYFIVANYLSPTEIKDNKTVKGTITKNNTVKLTNGKKLVSYFDFALDETNKCIFKEFTLEDEITDEITFKELRCGEFRVYKML